MLINKEKYTMSKNENKIKNQQQNKTPSNNKSNSQGMNTLESTTLQTKRYKEGK